MNMFKENTSVSPEEFIKKLEEPRRSEIQQIHYFILKTVPKLKPFMISGMIGYGKMHYKTKSGREGDWFTIGLASNKNYISIHACAVKDGKYIAEIHKDDLGKASVGKSCIRYKKFEDIPWKELANILKITEKESKTMAMYYQ